jgi:hypothetical protein
MIDDTLLNETELNAFKSEVKQLLQATEDQLLHRLFYADRTKHYIGKEARQIIRKQLVNSIKELEYEIGLHNEKVGHE